jgi:hypothetical protein
MVNIFSNTINWILDKLFGKKEEALDYPSSFILVKFSIYSLEDGIEDDCNKIIYFISYNKYGKREVREYPYSEERLYALQKTYNVPVFDKTDRKIKFPVYSKINPSEAVFVE